MDLSTILDPIGYLKESHEPLLEVSIQTLIRMKHGGRALTPGVVGAIMMRYCRTSLLAIGHLSF